MIVLSDDKLFKIQLLVYLTPKSLFIIEGIFKNNFV